MTTIQQVQTTTMRAILMPSYGPPERLELRDVPLPALADDRVLVRVRAASVNPLDWHTMRGEPYLMRLDSGLRQPKDLRLGGDVAGEVVQVGKDVTEFRPGDAVYGSAWGAFAEYVSARDRGLALKPARLSFEQAAAIPVAGYTAIQALRDKGQLQAGQRVLINGAAGGVGTFAVQIARALGAHVTGVCSGRNVELVRSLGAEHVIDYTREDVTRLGVRYDLILDAVGNHAPGALLRLLDPSGALVMVGAPAGRWIAPFAHIVHGMVAGRLAGRRALAMLAENRRDDLLLINEWVEAGALTPVIDRMYPLEEARAAIGYLEEGHARGKVVLTM